MYFCFTYCKSESTYETLLAKITFRYCNNLGGTIYTRINLDEKNAESIIAELIEQLTPFFITKKNTIILNLLVNPYFEELCNYLLLNPRVNKNKIRLLKRHVFSYLCDNNTRRMFSDPKVGGAEIYNQKSMYERSKRMLELL